MFRTSFPASALATACLLSLGPRAAQAQIASGVETFGRPAAALQAPFPEASLQEAIEALSADRIREYLALVAEVRAATGAVPAAIDVDFDDQAAPCVFAETEPLHGFEQGAYFSAPPARGGAILDGCSNFGVSPHSGANFLAFNASATYGEGRRPITPEIIVFPGDVGTVRLWLSSGVYAPHRVLVAALGAGGIQDVQPVVTTFGWAEVELTSADGRPIAAVLLLGGAVALVDDIHAE